MSTNHIIYLIVITTMLKIHINTTKTTKPNYIIFKQQNIYVLVAVKLKRKMLLIEIKLKHNKIYILDEKKSQIYIKE